MSPHALPPTGACLLLLVGLTGCTALAGLERLGFEGDPIADSSGSGSTGGEGGSTSSSGAGADEGAGAGFTIGCEEGDDRIVVSPLEIDTDAGDRGLDIVALGDAFGIVAANRFQSQDVLVTIIGRDDGLVRRKIVIPSYETDEFEPNITATRDRFVVPAPQSWGLEVHSFDGLAGNVAVASVELSFPPIQALATGTAGGVLLTLLDGAQIRSAFLETGDQTLALSPLPGPTEGQTTCCTYRAWHAGRYASGAFGVMWKPNPNYPANEFAAVDTDGTPDALAFTVPDMPIPAFAGPVGDELVLSDCDRAIAFSADGYPQATTELAGGSVCAVGMNGTSARVASVNGAQLDWQAHLSAVEVTTAMQLDLGSSSVTAVAMAWDGRGYGVVWRGDGVLRYARVEVCN